MKTKKYIALILGITFALSSNLIASENSTPVMSPENNPLGIGDISYSNQYDYERFKHSFYFFWAPLNLAHNQLSSYTGNYQSNYSNTQMKGLGVGVRHNILPLQNNFGVLGDYNLSTHWQKGTLTSTNKLHLSKSSSEINLFALDVTVKGLLAYTYREVVAPFLGIATTLISSRAQSSLGGGDNSFNEIHFGPEIGVQMMNFPIQNSFCSLEWIQYIKQGEQNSRVFSDGGREQISIGMNF